MHSDWWLSDYLKTTDLRVNNRGHCALGRAGEGREGGGSGAPWSTTLGTMKFIQGKA